MRILAFRSIDLSMDSQPSPLRGPAYVPQ
jgi:hypothetical protein